MSLIERVIALEKMHAEQREMISRTQDSNWQRLDTLEQAVGVIAPAATKSHAYISAPPRPTAERIVPPTEFAELAGQSDLGLGDRDRRDLARAISAMERTNELLSAWVESQLGAKAASR